MRFEGIFIMAKTHEFTDDQLREWYEWVSSRPQVIQNMCHKYPPNVLFRMDSGHRGYIVSYNEGGTVTVAVTGEYNLVAFDRSVFGVDPETLVECDLPGPDEKLGTALTTQGEVDDYIDYVREHERYKNN